MIGTLLEGRYQLGEQLGQGGMGTVYRAHDDTLDRDVAVKVLSGAGLGTEGRDRLLNEAQAIARLSHANIVSVFDAGQQDGTPYIVMEVIDGASLHDRAPQSMEEIARVAAQVCAALDHAHSHGVIHRDLKPENVLIAADGSVKLMDFGIARSVASRMTTEGEIVGTVFYLAPEIALGQEFDGRADLYSLGVMLYELTTGELPFAQGDPLAVISQHLHASVVPPRAKNESVPPRLDSLIQRLMEKSPEDRAASAREVQRELERADLLDPEAEGVKEIAVVRRIARGRFVGREQELMDATGLWNRALAGEGQLLLISGEPGIGKTRLVRELSTHVEVTGGQALVGECESEGGSPYAPFAQIVRKALRKRAQNGFELPEFVLADLLELAPELKPYHPEVSPNPKLEPEAEQRRLFENVVAFCQALSEYEPLMLVIDDAHWADSGTLALLRHLARRATSQRTLLTATYREVELDEAQPFHEALLDLNRKRLGTRLKLRRFDAPQTRDMLAAIFDAEEITPEFLEGIFGETEGNPFFIEEVCKALVESGQVFYENGQWDRVSMEEIEIPQSVRVAIQSRVSKFPEEYQEALNLAAILGREFDFDTLAEASELDEETLIEALEIAEDAQLIEEISGEGGATFSFVHALIPTTLAEGVRTLRRRRLHKRAAAAIEVTRPDDFEDLAFHHEEAGDEKRARSYYSRAGERALEAYANQEAEKHLRAALELGPSDSEQAVLLSRIAEATARLGRLEEATELWKETSEFWRALGDLEHVALCYTRMARTIWYAGDSAQTIAVCERGLALVEGAKESPELAGLIHEAARAYHFGSPDSEKADELCHRALEIARRVSATKVEADALTTLGVLSTLTTDEQIATLEQAVELSQREGFLDVEGRARNNLGVILGISQGDFRAAREHYLAAADLAKRMGDLTGELFCLNNASSSALSLGRIANADEILERAKSLIALLGDSGTAGGGYRYTLAYRALITGELELAADLYGELHDAALDRGDEFGLAIWGGQHAIVLLELGRFEECRAVAERAVEAADRANYAPGPAHAVLVQAFCRLANAPAAREALERAQSAIGDDPKLAPKLSVDLARADLMALEKRWEEAISSYEWVSAEFGAVEFRAPHAASLRNWADAHLARGEPGDAERARELLDKALNIYREMGAKGWIARTEARLAELEA